MQAKASQEIISQASGVDYSELLDQENISSRQLLMMDQNCGLMTIWKLTIGVITEGEEERLLFNYNQDGTQLRLNTLRTEEVQIW